MSGIALGLTIILTALITGATITGIVWLLLHYLVGRGVSLPGYLALLMRGHTEGEGTLWEPLIVNGDHDHDDRYATPDTVSTALSDHVTSHHGPHHHDDQYSLRDHTHEQYITRNELNRRLAALRVSQIPQNLFGALAIILVTTLLGALVGLLLDLTVLRHWLNHQVTYLYTGKVNPSIKTVYLIPHNHMVTDWLQALGVITFGSIAGFVIGAIIVLLAWWRRRRENHVVEVAN